MRLHPIHSPHDPSCKGLDVELKDGLESTNYMWDRKYLGGKAKVETWSVILASHLQGKPTFWLLFLVSPQCLLLLGHRPSGTTVQHIGQT
jgi:hypothetical protein